MQLPCLRPRLRLRTLLIAVAVAGLGFGGWTMWRRREECLELEAWYSGCIQHCRFQLKWIEGNDVETQRKRSELHAYATRAAQLAAQYRHVARYPWLPLPIEPPSPE